MPRENQASPELRLFRLDGSVPRDPSRLLEGTGKFMRHIKLRPGEATNETALNKLITAAYEDIKARVEHG
jgi:hypothetical protein